MCLRFGEQGTIHVMFIFCEEAVNAGCFWSVPPFFWLEGYRYEGSSIAVLSEWHHGHHGHHDHQHFITEDLAK